ncbi:hypothetical protein LSAT2_017359 [Lamellibrachia satsuma]|nr:hypothetical protein LSAT2_017359 [Lamellibrachia satsuma]
MSDVEKTVTKRRHVTQLTAAVESCNESAVIKLLKCGHNVNEISHTSRFDEPPLVTAARRHYLNIVRLLLIHRADVNATGRDGSTALMEATRHNATAIVKLLLDHGADTNVTDRVSHSALFWAVQHQNVGLVRELLEHGTNTNIVIQPHSTLLHLAARMGNISIATMLLQNGADVNAIDEMANTPLFVAVRVNSYGLAKLFLENGALVNQQDTDFRIALHIAAASVRPSHDMAQLLLDHGSMVNVCDRHGNTPLALHLNNFMLCQNRSMLHCLIQYGSDLSSPHSRSAFSWAMVRLCDFEMTKLAVDTGYRIPVDEWCRELLGGDSLHYSAFNVPNTDNEKRLFAEFLQCVQTNTRSLASHCRIAIRSHLIDVAHGTSIYNRIMQFPLPDVIKMFLLFKE